MSAYCFTTLFRSVVKPVGARTWNIRGAALASMAIVQLVYGRDATRRPTPTPRPGTRWERDCEGPGDGNLSRRVRAGEEEIASQSDAFRAPFVPNTTSACVLSYMSPPQWNVLGPAFVPGHEDPFPVQVPPQCSPLLVGPARRLRRAPRTQLQLTAESM